MTRYTGTHKPLPDGRCEHRWRNRQTVIVSCSWAAVERVRAEYQRFYDFVGDADPALVDAWHFTENAKAAASWPRPDDFARMTPAEFDAYTKRTGFDATIKEALAEPVGEPS